MVSADLLGRRFAYVQELSFKTGKRSDMGSANLQLCLIADCQEWCFVASKRPDM